MAGGADWFYVEHQDITEMRKDGDGNWFTQEHIRIVIERQEHALAFSAMRSDKGKHSGSIGYMIGDQMKSYVLGAGKSFLCIGDSAQRIQTPLKHVLRKQIWDYWGEEETVTF